MKFPLLILQLFVLAASYGQYEYLLSVKDKKGVQLPYASVSWGGAAGISANESGFVKISSIKPIDTFFISNIGHIPLTVATSDVSRVRDTLLFLLAQEQALLPPVIVISHQRTTEVGITAPQTSFVSNRYRNVLAAVLVHQPGQVCKIKSVSVFIHKKSQKSIPFRIRIFDKSENRVPGTDLLRNSVAVSTYQVNEWNEINLEENNVITESKDFFIAIEWLNIPDLKENNDLQIGLSNKDSRVITYYKIDNKAWKQYTIPGSKFDNIMIKATLAY